MAKVKAPVTKLNAMHHIGYGAGAAVQPDSAVLGIKLMCILIPGILGMGSWAAFRFIWDINAEKRAKVAEWKAERAAKAAIEE